MARDGLRPRVIVAVDTDEGITGWAEAYNHGPDRALSPVLDYLSLQIAGEDPRRIERLHLKMLQHARFPPGAIGSAAIAAIDHALHDISAKALGIPVYQLLGGNVRDRVRVYLGVYSAPDAETLRDHCAAAHEAFGLTAFKLSPYRADINADPWGKILAATVSWVAELTRLCPDWEFAFDAHARLYEPWQAVALGNALAPFHPLFFEEPIRPENVEAWGALKARLQVPLATGEALYNRWEFLRLLQCGGADIIQPDMAVVGGMTEMVKIANIASAFYVPVAPHNPMGPLATAHNVHFSAACPNFKILEYRLPGTSAMLERGLRSSSEAAGYVADPYVPADGHLELRPDRPGWGVEIDEDHLETDRYIHWERKLPIRPDGSTGYT